MLAIGDQIKENQPQREDVRRVGVGIAIASLATPFIIVAWIPVLFIFWNIQQKYRVTARELKRLTSIARSPIFAHFNETVTSLTVSIST